MVKLISVKKNQQLKKKRKTLVSKMSNAFLFVIAPKQFKDVELLETRRICQDAGFQVDVASTQVGDAVGMDGHVEAVSLSLENVNADAYDALVIVGGYGSVGHLWDCTMLHQLVNTFASAKKLVSAICVSPVVLAKAGVLSNQNATVWAMPESLEAFESHGVRYQESPVVLSNRLITANSPEAASAFGQALVAFFAIR
jgi:protease I